MKNMVNNKYYIVCRNTHPYDPTPGYERPLSHIVLYDFIYDPLLLPMISLITPNMDSDIFWKCHERPSAAMPKHHFYNAVPCQPHKASKHKIVDGEGGMCEKTAN